MNNPKLVSKRISPAWCDLCLRETNHLTTTQRVTDETTGTEILHVTAQCRSCKAVFQQKKLPAIK